MPTPEETAAAEKTAIDGIVKAKTKEDIVTVWKATYGIIGQRKLGRMLVGTFTPGS